MRIGLDFDNTLVCYDHIFALESNRLGIMPADWSGSKQELKDELLSHPDGERLWQTLQGRVYGPGMKQAVMYPGVAHFLMRSRLRGDDLFIVSHKTEFGHFDPERVRLLTAIADGLGGLLESARLNEDLVDSNDQLSAALDGLGAGKLKPNCFSGRRRWRRCSRFPVSSANLGLTRIS